MERSLTELLAQLQLANLNLRKRLEVAQAIVPELNTHIARLLAIGALLETPFVGNVIRQTPYALGAGPVDSSQVVVAMIRVPGGIGVLLIDSEDYLAAKRHPDGLQAEAATKFVPFGECPPAIQAMLLPYVASMLAQLCNSLDDIV